MGGPLSSSSSGHNMQENESENQNQPGVSIYLFQNLSVYPNITRGHSNIT